LRRFCHVPSRPRFCAQRPRSIRWPASRQCIPGRCVRNGFSAERGLSDFACIPTRIFTALDLNPNVQFSSVKKEIPGLTPIVIRGRMRLYAPDDCSIVITSVRRESSRFASRTHRITPDYDLELKTPQAHIRGSNPPSVSMPGQDRCRFLAVCGSAWFPADRFPNPKRRDSRPGQHWSCLLLYCSTALLFHCSTALAAKPRTPGKPAGSDSRK
jgi:hypothetical protein